MQDRDERDRERQLPRDRDENFEDTNYGSAALGDTNLADPSFDTDVDESIGGPENIVGGPSAPGTSFDPTRPLAEGANDSAREDPASS